MLTFTIFSIVYGIYYCYLKFKSNSTTNLQIKEQHENFKVSRYNIF